jgi:hypothetical protein
MIHKIGTEFPQDLFIKIENEEYRIGRITINSISGKFNAEIDIVQKESKKIWQHIDILYNYTDMDDLIAASVQCFSNYLATNQKK